MVLLLPLNMTGAGRHWIVSIGKAQLDGDCRLHELASRPYRWKPLVGALVTEILKWGLHCVRTVEHSI